MLKIGRENLQESVLSLVLIFRRTICDIAAGTAWITVPTYENILLRQQQTSQAFTPAACEVELKINCAGCRRKGLRWLLLLAAYVLISEQYPRQYWRRCRR